MSWIKRVGRRLLASAGFPVPAWASVDRARLAGIIEGTEDLVWLVDRDRDEEADLVTMLWETPSTNECEIRSIKDKPMLFPGWS